ncbi:MAG TPA: Gfo/Idh/MocA family oxidoreductase [Aquihabitans sp.]|jgi:predicted dehydrogenase|nr:Gfo/Idh/MocA family oxidoreductase [Aquihabitans sp.]
MSAAGSSRPSGTWRWGIAGTGAIAGQFSRDLAHVDGAVVTAVGSRSADTAQAFAHEHGIAHEHGSYEALADDPDVDIVYVASPHPWHAEHTLLFLAAGKHVLCEKPMAMSAAEVGTMVDAARRADRFLMEALWCRFLPAYDELRFLLERGVVGEPQVVQADLGYVAAPDPTSRLFDPVLGGGATLDLGIYPVQLGHLVFGPPDDIVATGHLAATGVDDHLAASLRHAGGGLTSITTSFRASLRSRATVVGTKGTLELAPIVHRASQVVVRDVGGRTVVEAPITGVGLHHQATEVQRCLAAGERESPVVPLDESLAMATTLDAILDRLGVRYPPRG